MAMFEKLKQGILDEITVKVCDFLIEDCDMCPKFISSRCKESTVGAEDDPWMVDESIDAVMGKIKNA